MSSNLFISSIEAAVGNSDVLDEVRKNYYNNLWWPVEVSDWRLRMLIAGWSTRVSYAHISHYSSVVENVSTLGWDYLRSSSDSDIRQIVKAIGLPESRIRYLRSLSNYIDSYDAETILGRENSELIEDLAQNVDGAGFKVAQCAVLYAKGYHSGIFPVDSGMLEMLQPLVPRRLSTAARSHEIMRLWMERLVDLNREKIISLARDFSFDLDLPSDEVPTWWVHLLLIYYKRLIWNKGIELGPFRRAKYVTPKDEADRPTSNWTTTAASFPRIILEGPDGAGKSTIASILQESGYRTEHFSYKADVEIMQRHRRPLDESGEFSVFDRSFISEYVNGPIRRGRSRLTNENFNELLEIASRAGFIVVFIDEDEYTLQHRRPSENLETLKSLRREYLRLSDSISGKVPTYYLKPSQLSEEGIRDLMGLVPANS